MEIGFFFQAKSECVANYIKTKRIHTMRSVSSLQKKSQEKYTFF
jgi:hypothetical protein